MENSLIILTLFLPCVCFISCDSQSDQKPTVVPEKKTQDIKPPKKTMTKEKEIAESIIKIVHDYYDKVRRKFPNKKEIFYLSLTWAIYKKKHHSKECKDKDLAYLLMPGSSDTLIFSSLETPDSIDALSYYMVHKERLSVAKDYEPRFNEIMTKVKITESQIEEETKKMVTYILDESENVEGLSEKDF